MGGILPGMQFDEGEMAACEAQRQMVLSPEEEERVDMPGWSRCLLTLSRSGVKL